MGHGCGWRLLVAGGLVGSVVVLAAAKVAGAATLPAGEIVKISPAQLTVEVQLAFGELVLSGGRQPFLSPGTEIDLRDPVSDTIIAPRTPRADARADELGQLRGNCRPLAYDVVPSRVITVMPS